MLRGRPHVPWCFAGCLLTAAGWLSPQAMAQTAADTPQQAAVRQAVTDLQQQIRELQSAVAEIKAEAAEYRAETHALRAELEATRSQLQLQKTTESEVATNVPSDSTSSQSAVSLALPQQSKTSDRLAKLEEEYQLLTGKIDDQYQTKEYKLDEGLHA